MVTWWTGLHSTGTLVLHWWVTGTVFVAADSGGGTGAGAGASAAASGGGTGAACAAVGAVRPTTLIHTPLVVDHSYNGAFMSDYYNIRLMCFTQAVRSNTTNTQMHSPL
jgi:hypothetical protein